MCWPCPSQNMVGRGAVDEELEDEVAGECGKYGEVENCITYEVCSAV